LIARGSLSSSAPNTYNGSSLLFLLGRRSPDLCFSVNRKAMTSEPEAFPSVVGVGWVDIEKR